MEVRISSTRHSRWDTCTILRVEVTDTPIDTGKSVYWRTPLLVIYSDGAPVALIRQKTKGAGLPPMRVRVASDGLSGVQMRHAKEILGSTFSTVETVSAEEMRSLIVENISTIIGLSIDTKLIG